MMLIYVGDLFIEVTNEFIHVKPRRISNIKLQNPAWINVTVIPKTEIARIKMKRARRSR